MKSYRKELWFNVPGRRGFINITPDIQECLHESGVQEGLVLVNAMHITASVFINDDERGLHADYENWLEDNQPTLYQEARESVDHILSSHRPAPLDPHVEQELARIVDAARKVPGVYPSV